MPMLNWPAKYFLKNQNSPDQINASYCVDRSTSKFRDVFTFFVVIFAYIEVHYQPLSTGRKFCCTHKHTFLSTHKIESEKIMKFHMHHASQPLYIHVVEIQIARISCSSCRSYTILCQYWPITLAFSVSFSSDFFASLNV